MSRYLTTAAITLDRRLRGEDDRRYTLLTRSLGKVEAVAEGSQKITSKLAGHLEPFAEVVVTLVQRTGSVKITGAVSRQRWHRITEDAARYQTATWCLRIARLGTGPTPDAASWRLLRGALSLLDTADPRAAKPVAAAFALQLLARLGLQPQLSRCGRCGAAVAERDGAFDVANGCTLCPACATAGETVVPLAAATLRELQQGASAPLASALRRPASPATDVVIAVIDRFVAYRFDAASS